MSDMLKELVRSQVREIVRETIRQTIADVIREEVQGTGALAPVPANPVATKPTPTLPARKRHNVQVLYPARTHVRVNTAFTSHAPAVGSKYRAVWDACEQWLEGKDMSRSDLARDLAQYLDMNTNLVSLHISKMLRLRKLLPVY